MEVRRRARLHPGPARQALRPAPGGRVPRHQRQGDRGAARPAGPGRRQGLRVKELQRLVALARTRLAARPDTEHEQAIVRLVVGLVLFFYLLPEAPAPADGALQLGELYLGVMFAYLAFAAAVVASILVHPGVSAVRRLLSV